MPERSQSSLPLVGGLVVVLRGPGLVHLRAPPRRPAHVVGAAVHVGGRHADLARAGSGRSGRSSPSPGRDRPSRPAPASARAARAGRRARTCRARPSSRRACGRRCSSRPCSRWPRCGPPGRAGGARATPSRASPAPRPRAPRTRWSGPGAAGSAAAARAAAEQRGDAGRVVHRAVVDGVVARGGARLHAEVVVVRGDEDDLARAARVAPGEARHHVRGLDARDRPRRGRPRGGRRAARP